MNTEKIWLRNRAEKIAAVFLLVGALILLDAAASFPDRLELALHGRANANYVVEASTDLKHWTAVATNRTTATGALGFQDPQAAQFPQRYYRGVQITGTGTLSSLGLLGENYDATKILVKPKAGVDLSGLNLSLGVAVLHAFPAIGNLQIIKVTGSFTASTLIAFYQRSGLVEYAEPDFYVQALNDPDDPHYVDGDMWHLKNTGQYGGSPGADIHASAAWDKTTSASNVIVAVVDTGVRYTHEDLAANMWVNPADGSHGTNTIAGNTDPNDDHGHGTHVSGTIGAVGNNGLGVAGVCWKVQIMALKFLDSTGDGTISDAVLCFDYARTHGAKVVNASWGTPTFTSQALHDAIASLRDADIVFVAAAGNSGDDNDTTPLYPASYRDLDNVVAVAATDRNDQLASFSDYGANSVDLAAPGTPIKSCWNGSDSDYQDDDGTSMACAQVAGAAALLRGYYPNENYRQVIQQILNGTDPLPSLAGKTITGGRLDLAKALGTSSPPPTLTANFTASANSGPVPLAVQFTDTSTGSPISWNWNFGDGGTSTTKSPSHTFNFAGSFTATLTVTGGDSSTSSKSQTITVTNMSSSGQPVITLTATRPDAYANGQVPGTINFHRTGDVSQSYEVYWAFSGTASNGVDYEQLPTHSPFPAGQEDATLTITPIDHGQTGDQTVIVTLASGPAYQIGSPGGSTVTIHGAPAGLTASFIANPTSGNAPLTVQFTDTSTGGPTSWNWNFGDGSAHSTTQNPSHTYNAAGSFTVTLTVANRAGQTSSTSSTITATNATQTTVTANFLANPTSGQAPLAVQFTDQSSGPVISWNWNFGDGATSTTQNPNHTYSSAATFTATLTVDGGSGQTDSASRTITVTNAPPPSATATVVASQPLASLLAPGVFTITRSGGDTSSALTVNYSMGGSTVNGVDYRTLSGTAVIPAGSASTTVVVQPQGLLTVLKTVVLTLSSNSSYAVGSPNSASVTILVSVGGL